jgi:hypothetical protein
MTNQNIITDAERASAQRVVLCLTDEAHEREGSEQGQVWTELARLVASRWGLWRPPAAGDSSEKS